MKRLSLLHNLSLSTLKLNARVLRDLGLISFKRFVELTDSGKLVKTILGDYDGS